MWASIKISRAMLLLLFFMAQSAIAQTPKERWVDSVYKKLSLQERIGQLFMVAAYSGGKNYNEDLITNLVNKGQVGGLIYMQGTAEAQATQTNKHQRNSKVPLLIAMDAEWGLGMRLTGVINMPRQMMYGAAGDSTLVYQMGMAIAYQCKRLGVHIDFAPVVDVNNNPNNPVINFRSFGEQKNEVARLGIAYMKGLQDNGVMACAKHFPGHGDTETDSHKDMPTITKTKAELDELELYPFKRMIAAGIKSVMVAHLEVPAIEKTPKLPTTLSYSTITNLLRKEMGFKGLIFTDALNMQGVAKYYQPGEVDLKAFKAGNDVLLFSQDVPTGIDKIEAALNAGNIPMTQLENSVKKILAAKYDAGLTTIKVIDPTNATSDINSYTNGIKRDAARAAVTLVKDENGILQQLKEPNNRVQYIGVNENNSAAAWERLKKQYNGARASFLPKGSSAGLTQTILQSMSTYDVNIIVVHNMSFYPGVNYGLDAQQMNFIRQASQRAKTLLIIDGNPYMLKNFCAAKSVVVAYEDDEVTQNAMVDVLTGIYPFKGHLPVTACYNTKKPYSAPEGVKAEEINKPVYIPVEQKKNLTNADVLTESSYEAVGVSRPEALPKLDAFIKDCISKGAFPGCRILAAKDGKVFYDKAFGRLTYSIQSPAVTKQTYYDVASVTKILATTIAVMRLYEQGKIDLNAPVSNYLKWTKNTDKANLKIKDLLLHQAGLKSWIPFYKSTLDSNGDLRADLYRTHPQKGFTYKVANNLFIKDSYNDSVWDQIVAYPLENLGRYVYSDLDMYFLAAVVEAVSHKAIDQYVQDEFYKPMQLTHLLFNPLEKIKAEQIAPTENDLVFRKQQIQGYVHDPGAAMLGGIAGHAGLFGTAQDVGAVFQMLLNDGTYRGKQFLKKSTVDFFTSYQSAKSRRGLGFDKPSPSNSDAGPVGERASSKTFGHQGFTGTCVWADPETGILFVFLSNRVYPDAENNGITRWGVRTVAQDYIYEAFDLPVNKNRKAGYPF